VSFDAITLCITSQRVFLVVVTVYFVIDSPEICGYTLVPVKWPRPLLY
jgi:hypothetical protein